MNQPVIITQRLELWQPAAGDLSGLHAMLDDTDTLRFLGRDAPTMAESFDRLLRNAGSWVLHGYGTFVVRFRGEREIAGICGVFRSYRGHIDDDLFHDGPEAGWIVDRNHWRQGVASEAMRAALSWFDEAHGRQRIGCMIEEGNTASIRVAQSLGFTPRGRPQLDEDAVLLLFERT